MYSLRSRSPPIIMQTRIYMRVPAPIYFSMGRLVIDLPFLMGPFAMGPFFALHVRLRMVLWCRKTIITQNSSIDKQQIYASTPTELYSQGDNSEL